MKKLDTYIAKQIVTGFLLVALSLMSMLWLTQSLRFVEMVTDKGLPVYLFVEMTSLLMPRVFTILSPIALFVAVMFVYNRLITDSELVVMKAVGISSVVIARAALLVGAVLALFNVFVLNVGIPAAEGKFRDLEYEVKNSFSKMMLREGAFTSFKNNMTIFIDKFLDDGTVKGILVSDGKNPAEKVVTVAESGMLEYTDIGPKILLKNGTRQVMNKKSGQFSSMTFDDYVVDFGDVSVARKKIRACGSGASPNCLPKQKSRKFPKRMRVRLRPRRIAGCWRRGLIWFCVAGLYGAADFEFQPPGAGESHYGFYFGYDTGAGSGYDVCEYGAPVRVDCSADVC